MPSLQDLLAEAASRDAHEVVMETGQPVLLNTEQGGVPLGSPMTEDDLFAALTAVLSEEQQVELAVGNVIEFDIVAKGDWHVLTEPGAEGISVRARLAGQGAAAPAGPSIDLPPVAPFQGARVSLPPMSAEDSFSNVPVQRPTPREVEAPELADDFGAPPPVEVPAPPTIDAFGGQPAPPEVGPPPGSPFSAPPAVPPLDPTFESPAAPAHPGPPDEIGIPLDDETDVSVDDEKEDTLEFSIVPPPASPPPPASSDADTRNDLARAQGERTEAATRMDLVPPPASPVADTRSDLSSVADSTPPVSGTLEEVAAQLPEAGLVFVHHSDPAGVLRLLHRESMTVGDSDDPFTVAPRVHALPYGSIVVITAEDCGAWLGWALRRLEEGHLVLVQTRALTAGGAKRCLLGPNASVRAESWLARHTVRSMMPTDDVWTLVLAQ